MFQSIFLICFGVGAAYTVLSFLMGNLLDLGDCGEAEIGTASFLRPAPIAAFLTVFGGVGLTLYWRFGFIIALAGAIVVGILVAYALIKFILMPLHRAQNTSTVEKQSLIGQIATVNEKIFKDGFGKISYHVNGSTFSSPAKSEDGEEISKGTNVEIVYIEKNTYHVRPKYEG
jgi:membrane protein implicated in regulation of membrane protease activity